MAELAFGFRVRFRAAKRSQRIDRTPARTSSEKSDTSSISDQQITCRTVRVSAVQRDLCRNVPHHLSQLAGTDLVEEAVQLDMFRDCRARAKQLDIILDGLLEIHDGKAIMIKHPRDVSGMMIVELLDEELGRQSRRAAERVVNHNDILNAEYIVHGRHGLQSERGASTRVSLDK